MIVERGRETPRDRQISNGIARPFGEIQRPSTRQMEAAALLCRQSVALKKVTRVADALRGGHSLCERGHAIDVEFQLLAGTHKLSVFHEVRSGLPELRRNVLEGFHRGSDLSELDRAHVRARVVGSAELRLT
jgi:hypothetical protein